MHMTPILADAGGRQLISSDSIDSASRLLPPRVRPPRGASPMSFHPKLWYEWYLLVRDFPLCAGFGMCGSDLRASPMILRQAGPPSQLSERSTEQRATLTCRCTNGSVGRGCVIKPRCQRALSRLAFPASEVANEV
ncbi:hypothetical protein M758_N021600 [Ceratodon purpureus]|nr:hypothetical protein M758_N021600 [Ceratodon purpureus]